MTLPSSGPLTLTNIQTEFGGSNPIGLNEYYAGGSYVPSGTTGTNGAVPASGAISIWNFYGTSAINPNFGVTWSSYTPAGSSASSNPLAFYASETTSSMIISSTAPNYISFSTDGTTWTYRTTSAITGTVPGTGIGLIGASNSVVGGVDSNIAYTTDGINWINSSATLRATGWVTLANIIQIRVFNNKFVILGEGGELAESADGSSYTRRSAGLIAAGWPTATSSSNNPAGIAYNGTTYVITGGNGRCATSSDLITWTLNSGITSIVSTSIAKVVAGSSSAFIASINNATICFLTSNSTGTVWQNTTSNILATGVGTARYFNSGVFANNKFVIAGAVTAQASSEVSLWSYDGFTWVTSTGYGANFSGTGTAASMAGGMNMRGLIAKGCGKNRDGSFLIFTTP